MLMTNTVRRSNSQLRTDDDDGPGSNLVRIGLYVSRTLPTYLIP